MPFPSRILPVAIPLAVVFGAFRAPASVVPLERLVDARFRQLDVTTSGVVIDTFRDDVDPGWEFLLLKKEGSFLLVAFPARHGLDPSAWLDAEISVTGQFFERNGGVRRFAGPYLSVLDPATNAIRVIKSISGLTYDCPPLDQTQWIAPKDVVRLGRRSVSGVVLARWNGDRLAVRTCENDTVIVQLRSGISPAPPGRTIRAVGYPETDLYRLHLTQAVWRDQPDAPTPPPQAPVRVSPRQFFLDESGHPRMPYRGFNGKLVVLSGTVSRLTADDNALHVDLDCQYGRIAVEVDARAAARWAGLAADTGIEVTGICLMECEAWNPSLVLPRIKACRLFVREENDIRVLSHPPWWTPGRLALVIAALAVILVGLAIWGTVLKALVRRQGLELARELTEHVGATLRTDERTRLAVELHDALSQNLEGVAFQIAATKDLMSLSPEAAKAALDAAGQMLLSSRTELRRCLFDLRHDALEAKSFDEALRTTLEPISSDATLVIRFNVRRDIFSEASAHIVLCIIRELVSNAVRHGKASQVRIAGEHHDGRLCFSVRDNGSGFDTSRCPGPDSGHFGLDGIRERIRRLNGVFTIESCPGGPTRAVITAGLGAHSTRTDGSPA